MRQKTGFYRCTKTKSRLLISTTIKRTDKNNYYFGILSTLHRLSSATLNSLLISSLLRSIAVFRVCRQPTDSDVSLQLSAITFITRRMSHRMLSSHYRNNSSS